MTALTPANPNPLTRAALTLSPAAASTTGIIARLAGAGFALLYAYNQYAELDDVFARTWTFCVAIVVLAVGTLALARVGWMGRVAMAAGSAALLFGGAMLAREVEGQAVLVAGIIAWLATAATESRERGSAWLSVLGLAAGAAITFAIAIGTAGLPS